MKKNNFLDSHQPSNRAFKGNNNDGAAGSPSPGQKADESGCLYEEEPLTERFIKDDNINSKSNSIRRHAYEQEYAQPGGPLPEGLVSLSPQTGRKSPPMASCRQQEQRFGNKGTYSHRKRMPVVDLQETARYNLPGQRAPEERAEAASNEEDEEDEIVSAQATVLDSKSVAIQDGIDDEYLAHNLCDYGLEGSLSGAFEHSQDGVVEGFESPVENDVRFVNLRITNTSKQVQMRKRLSQIKGRNEQQRLSGTELSHDKLEEADVEDPKAGPFQSNAEAHPSSQVVREKSKKRVPGAMRGSVPRS